MFDFLGAIGRWKIWGVMAGVIAVMFMGLKVQKDRAEDRAEAAEDALVGAEAEGSINAWEAVQTARDERVRAERAKYKEERADETLDDDVITTSVD